MVTPTLPDTPRSPARPKQLTLQFHEAPDTFVVHKKQAGVTSILLLLWLCIWTIGCFMLLVGVINSPSPVTVVFALPFWAAWWFVACLLVWGLFGKESLFLGRGDALFVRSALIRLASRVVPRNEIRGFREYRSAHTENGASQWGIEMITLGKPIRFAFGLTEEERGWLIHQLNRFLATPNTGPDESVLPSPANRATGAFSRADYRSRESPPVAEVLTFDQTLAEPPASCRWRLREASETFMFRKKGQLNVGALGLLYFLNVFWNGIVAVLASALTGRMAGNGMPQDLGWWALFLFLIPIGAIGLILFVVLVLIILEPIRRTQWLFEWDRIVNRTHWAGLGRSRAWDIAVVDRLELRRWTGSDPTLPLPLQIASGIASGPAGETPFELAFVTSDNLDLCHLRGLTEGEARWMARVILNRRANWFGR